MALTKFQSEWLASVNTSQPKAKRNPIERWVSVYPKRVGAGYDSKQLCDMHAQNGRLECVHLVEATEAKEIWRLLEKQELPIAGDEYYLPAEMKWQTALVGYDQYQNVRRRVRVIEVIE